MNQQILFTTRTTRRVNAAPVVGLLAPISDFGAWKIHRQNGADASRVMDGNALEITILNPAANNSIQLRNEEGTAANGQNLRLRFVMWATQNFNFQLTSDGPAPNYDNLGLSVSVMLTTTPTLFEFDFTTQNYTPGANLQHFLPSFYIGNAPQYAKLYVEAPELITR